MIIKNGQRDTMLWALKIGKGGCEPGNVNWKTPKVRKTRHAILLIPWF